MADGTDAGAAEEEAEAEESEEYGFRFQLGQLSGALVEIFGMEMSIRPMPLQQYVRQPGPDLWADEDEDRGTAAIDANGQAGQALYFDPTRLTYSVMTFDGLLLRVPEAHLRECDQLPPELGGFDLLWPLNLDQSPSDGEEQAFLLGAQMVEHILQKGFVVVQLWNSPSQREAVARCTQDINETGGWHLPRKQFETTYLGRGNCTKYAVVKAETVEPPSTGAGAADELGEAGENESEGPLGPVQVYNRLLSQAALALEPHGEMLGCELWGRMPGLLRVPLGEEGKDKELRRHLRPAAESSQAVAEEDVWGQITFLQRRTLMLLCTIETSGGELELIPRDDLDEEPIVLPLSRNKLIVFNSQLLAHQYSPWGAENFALQTWLLKEAELPDPSSEPVVELPTQLQQARPHIMATMVNYPGQSLGPQHLWMTACAGSDTLTTVPTARFDMDLYYRQEPAEGWSYAYHGAFTSDSGLLFFDNEKFKITAAEAKRMSPAQRTVLETGYQALARAGHSMASLQGAQCGVFLGDSGSLWEVSVADSEALSSAALHLQFRSAGGSSAISGSRLSHCLGLQGPVTTVDTACSSSLVAVTLAHDCVRKAAPLGPALGRSQSQRSSSVPNALAVGVNLLLHPKWYVLYSGPRMLSPRGRCFTFDGSADGYARGEGCGSLYLACSEDERQDVQMLACLAGSAANQDGKSASMTAPHGPSQQQCIMASLAEMELRPHEMAMAECHGTGTALGDPIEVGALRAVTLKRRLPVLCASAKTVLGHLEASAGLAGLVKCVLTAVYSSGPPNCHFDRLNPHLDVNGYPICFISESSDFHARASLVGVSSFGFGGTNARSDIWGRAQLGPRAARRFLTPAQLDREMCQFERVQEGHRLGPLEGEVIHAVGSWDAYQSTVALERTASDFRFEVTLGETLREIFQLRVNNQPDQTLHPGIRDADQDQDIAGPEPETGATGWWLIDGRSAGMAEGTVYQVVFSWRFSWELGEYKNIWWEPLPTTPRMPQAQRAHSYHVLGTWNSWQFQEMQSGGEDGEEGLWRCDVRIGITEREEFRFARDADWRQLIYPATPHARKTTVPIQGPDSLGSDKAWLLRGPQGEVVSIALRVLEGEISMSTHSPTAGSKVWQSGSALAPASGPGQTEYSVSGSWNDWVLNPMLPTTPSRMEPQAKAKATSKPTMFRCRARLGPSGAEEFQLAVGGDLRCRLYPAIERARLGEAEMCGPDEGQDGLTWLIEGRPGDWVDIILDTTEVDRTWAVWWADADPNDAAEFDPSEGSGAE